MSVVLILYVSHALAECTAIGAIRWDAWFGEKGLPGIAVTKSLAPEKWHGRLPFCAKVISQDTVQIECDTQDVMDQEIAFAKKGGIDYWAFVAYGLNSPMSSGLKNYLSSSRKKDINFSLITTASILWNKRDYSSTIDRVVKLMMEPSYQKTAGDRPLVYIAFIKNDWVKAQWGDDAAFEAIINEFRQRSQKYGAGNPYIVVMDFDFTRAKQIAERFGFDAISSYIAQGGASHGKYSELAAFAERYWVRSSGSGASVVPILMAGWDRRPRVENPVPWENKNKSHPDDAIKYYEKATPEELGQHLENALNWTKKNSFSAKANTVLFYAWNEFDEGGWLAPTLLDDDKRLDALGNVARRDCPEKLIQP